MDVNSKIKIVVERTAVKNTWRITAGERKHIGWIGEFGQGKGILLNGPLYRGWTIGNLEQILEFMKINEAKSEFKKGFDEGKKNGEKKKPVRKNHGKSQRR